MCEKCKEQLEENISNPYDIPLEVKTEFGSLKATYNFRDALTIFEDYFRYLLANKEKGTVDVTRWQAYLTHAEESLKEIIPQLFSDAIEQAALEARARALNELNDASYFTRQTVLEGNKEVHLIDPIQLPKFNAESVRDFCEDVAQKAYKDSRRRMRINKKGGSDKKLGGYYYAALENYYDQFSSQAKAILKFYKWKKEEWEKKSRSINEEKWHSYFLEILFKIPVAEVDILGERKEKSKNKKEKLRYETLEKAALEIISIKGDEIKRWKETFSKVLAKDYKRKEIYNFDELTPENLTYELLSIVFDASAGTIENNLKKLRREKKRMLKGSD